MWWRCIGNKKRKDGYWYEGNTFERRESGFDARAEIDCILLLDSFNNSTERDKDEKGNQECSGKDRDLGR